MVDLTGKAIITESDEESEELLRIAVAQGYHLPKGLKAMVGERIFKFSNLSSKDVFYYDEYPFSNVKLHKFSDLFGNEMVELNELAKTAAQICQKYGYSVIRVCTDEDETEYASTVFVKADDQIRSRKVEYKLRKPVELSQNDIERILGYPVKIVS